MTLRLAGVIERGRRWHKQGMKHRLTYLFVAALAGAGFACETEPEDEAGEAGETAGESGEAEETGETGETGETSETEESSETGDPVIPCEERSQANCAGAEDPDDEYGNSCIWASLIPLPDQGNSCAMEAPIGRCMAIAPVLDGCGGAPELECTLGDTTEYGNGAVMELDGTVYLYDGDFDCWPPNGMTTCEGDDTAPGCECACDRILGG